MASVFYPPVAFSFSVQIAGDRSATGASFQEASGLDAETEVLTVNEGGENRFSHRLPGRTRYPNLVLKRGIMWANAPLFTWSKATLEDSLSHRIDTKDIRVSLLDQEGAPQMTWALARAYPVKWAVGALNAQDNNVAVETVEFAYQRITRRAEAAMSLGSG